MYRRNERTPKRNITTTNTTSPKPTSSGYPYAHFRHAAIHPSLPPTIHLIIKISYPYIPLHIHHHHSTP